MANYFSHKSTAVRASGGFYDIGTIIPWTKATVLDGFLLCDGSSRSKTGEYAALFAVIDTTYGTGDSNDGTTFSLPNLLGRSIVGEGTSNDGTTTRAFNIGESSGATNVTSNVSFPSATVTISGTNLNAPIASAPVPIPAHSHNWSQSGITGGIYGGTAIDSGPQRGKAFGFGELSNQVSRDGPNNNVRGIAAGIESAANSQNLNDVSPGTQSTNIAFLQVSGTVASHGAGTGVHNHQEQAVSGNVSFNQTNLNATNTGSTISPYGVCRYIIKAKEL